MREYKEIIDEFDCRVLFKTKQDYLDYIKEKHLDTPIFIRYTFSKTIDNNDDFIKGEPTKYPCVMWYTVECKTCGTNEGLKDITMFQGEYIYKENYINYMENYG